MAEINDLSTTDANNTARWPEGMAPSQVNNSARADEGIIARFTKDALEPNLTSTGASNAYLVTTNRTLSAYYTGLRIAFKASFANTGAATVNVNSLGAKNIYRRTSSGVAALAGGEIRSGDVVELIYDGTQFQLVSAHRIEGDIDIAGLTALTAPAADDVLPIYDLSALANRKITLADLFKAVTALTAETAPASDDELTIYDTSAGTADKITLANVLKVVNSLTEDTAPDAANDFVLTYDASAGAAKKVKPSNLVSGVIADIQTFTASGTWTKPSGATWVMVELWGGGGGGGRTSGGQAGGGGGGGYSQRLFRASDLSSTVAVTVGAGGTGRTGSDGDGSDGGTTSFGAHLSATGGGGGKTSGAGGTGGNGLNAGGAGGAAEAAGGNSGYGGGGGGGGSGATAPSGGNSIVGGGGGAGGRGGFSNPVAGTAPGGGGGGGSGAQNGADGARGEAWIYSW